MSASSARRLSTARKNGSGFITIPTPPPKGRVVRRAVTVAGVVAEVVDGHGHHAGRLRALQDARFEHRREHLREGGEHVNPHDAVALEFSQGMSRGQPAGL